MCVGRVETLDDGGMQRTFPRRKRNDFRADGSATAPPAEGWSPMNVAYTPPVWLPMRRDSCTRSSFDVPVSIMTLENIPRIGMSSSGMLLRSTPTSA